jgi:glutathione-regulated potassium-efflux system protein KefB
MDLGIEDIEREAFLGSLELTKDLLMGLGTRKDRAKWIIDVFKESDERRLYDDYKHHTDAEKMAMQARKQSQELEELFAEDEVEENKAPETPVKLKTGTAA